MTIIGVIASSITGGLGGAGFYESIATGTGNGSSNTITFSNIPQTYAHLQIRGVNRGTATGSFFSTNISMRINNDSTSVYNFQEIYGNGVGISAFASASNWVMETAGSTWATNNFIPSIFDILDYTSTNKAKTIRSIWAGIDMGNNGAAAQTSLFYSASPAAITRLDLIINSGNFATGTQFALYGIKVA